jgi:hypothetical protein
MRWQTLIVVIIGALVAFILYDKWIKNLFNQS